MLNPYGSEPIAWLACVKARWGNSDLPHRFAFWDYAQPFNPRIGRSATSDEVLCRLGARLMVPPESFIVAGREGPLLGGELERAGNWARTLAQAFEASSAKLRAA